MSNKIKNACNFFAQIKKRYNKWNKLEDIILLELIIWNLNDPIHPITARNLDSEIRRKLILATARNNKQGRSSEQVVAGFRPSPVISANLNVLSRKPSGKIARYLFKALFLVLVSEPRSLPQRWRSEERGNVPRSIKWNWKERPEEFPPPPVSLALCFESGSFSLSLSLTSDGESRYTRTVGYKVRVKPPGLCRCYLSGRAVRTSRRAALASSDPLSFYFFGLSRRDLPLPLRFCCSNVLFSSVDWSIWSVWSVWSIG